MRVIERICIAERKTCLVSLDGREGGAAAVRWGLASPLVHLPGHFSDRLIVWNGRPRVINTRLELGAEPAAVAARRLFTLEFRNYRGEGSAHGML